MKKKIISGLVSLMMLLSILPSSMTAYADASFLGAGTGESPYLISTAEDLVKLAELTNSTATAAEYADKYYRLTADIDMAGIDYKPVSYATDMYKAQGSAFKGTLDGNNHIIKNVNMTPTIAAYGATYGIVGYLGANGVVKNLGVENMSVDGGNAKSRLCIGGIAGSLNSSVTIENSYVRGMTVTVDTSSLSDKTTYAGGIAGRTIGGEGLIKNCYTNNLNFSGVTFANNKAGIMGSCGNTGYKAENCYTTNAKVQGNTSATNSYMGEVNCYSSATIGDATVENLGDAFKVDSKGKNGGYPLLSWEEEASFIGDGTSENPYLINDANDLVKLANLTNTAASAEYASKYYQLTADIDMTGIAYKPISYATDMYKAIGSAFKGTLDGNNHIIKNVTMTSAISAYGATYGIIGYLGPNGVVKNLGVENMTIDGGNTKSRLCIGGIAGSLSAPVTIENSYVRGMTVAVDTNSLSDKTTYVGGITGRTIGGEGVIKNCYTTSLDFSGVTYANHKAGIMGSCGNTGYKAENCYTTDAKVQGNTSATNSYMGATNCYSSSTIKDATVANLGTAFKADLKGNNGGYPMLVWEAEKSAFQGEGTSESPYLLNSAEDLVKLANLTNTSATAAEYADKYYKLTADIDMTGISYKPISFATSMYTALGSSFKGTLDGNNHIIKNVTMPSSYATYGATYGVVGYLGPNGTVKNLGVENMTVNGGSANRLCIGGIAGSLSAPVTIESCYVRGMTVTTTSTDVTYVGGITGRTIGGEGIIKNCYTTKLDFGGVTYANHKAGIMGSCGNSGYKAENCYTTDAKVQGNTAATNSYMATTNCYSLSTIGDATVANLGDAFKADTKVNNGGYPLLSWETEKEAFQGEGTSEKPYLIREAEDLAKLSTLTNSSATAADYVDKYYKLTADIDMAGIAYKPISFATNMYTAQGSAFKGTLDGNNHIIKNVTMNSSYATYGATYGIIGYLGANGTVKNLGVENMSVDGGNKASRLCIGGIAGSLSAPVTIENCYVRNMSATVNTADLSDKTTYAGGITGRTIGGEGLIKNCYTTELDFTGVTFAGNKAGIMGSCGNTGYKAENCYTTDAKIQGNTAATNTYMGTTNCYAASEIPSANVLGLAFIADVDGINGGNPVLTWEYAKNNPTQAKKTVTITKTGSGEINVAGLGNVEAFTAYAKQNVVFTLVPEEGYVSSVVSYRGSFVKEVNGKYTIEIGEGGELKVAFSQIVDGDVEFYVSANGNDGNDGLSQAAAFKTIEAAVSAAKAYSGAKVINIEAGVYNVEDTILLDADDSGIVLRSVNGGDVVLNGGKKIEKSWFTTYEENANLLVADLKAHGITEYGRIKSVGYGTYADTSDKNASPVLTIDGKYQVPARYPNSGYIKTNEIITGAENTENLSFKTSDSRVSNWAGEKDAWVFGYFKEEWADANLPVTVSEDGVITANGKSHYGAKKGSRFYIFNALSELDTVGEYYIDREDGKMYIYKSSDWSSVENIVFSAGDNNIIEISGAKNVTLDGLTFTNTNASGVVATDADGIAVKNCVFENIGRTAINLKASGNALVDGNSISDIGYVGIQYVNAGDRQTLTSCGAKISNNQITRTGLQQQAGAYAIDITNTVGAVVSGNEIYDLPHGGILYMTCNDAVIEYNEIYNVIKDISDAGAIYSGRDWTTRGNVIRYNYIHDIVDIKDDNNASAIYFDDMHSSTSAYGNVIYRVPQAILLGGGRDNTFTNNLIIDCNRWIEADRRGTRTDLAYMKHMLSQVPYTSEAWSKYDNLVNILDDEPGEAKYNVIKDNVTYNSSSSYFHITDMYNVHHTVGNPDTVYNASFFYSYSDKQFGLSENAQTIDAGAYELIKDIPFEKMGFATAQKKAFTVENVEVKEVGADLVANVKMVNTTSDSFQAKLIIAQYNGDRLEACAIKPVPVGANQGEITDSLSASKDSDTTSYKVFLWNADMEPLWK